MDGVNKHATTLEARPRERERVKTIVNAKRRKKKGGGQLSAIKKNFFLFAVCPEEMRRDHNLR
jgi:hypothetical protein